MNVKDVTLSRRSQIPEYILDDGLRMPETSQFNV